jgi:hypothetical protein
MCRKRCHRSKAKARQTARKIKSRPGNKGRPLGVEVHPYWCEECQAWHLTKQTPYSETAPGEANAG